MVLFEDVIEVFDLPHANLKKRAIHHVKNKTKDRDINGRICRKYTGPSLNWKVAFPKGCPKSWRNMIMTRPKRIRNKQLCHQILKGSDSNELTFPLGNA
ncbi:hypothetical protein [Legionella longbeachae]|uniref:Uncharacterized protein n=1 Tax=Legionella longbeachae serogroup 1 (strain NSW150) TaxID=661367 RepID=D3HML9_LEGLN|nr:hypothetical protein [Legionella longbeachae]VEE04135.1 Uncharacterised protein [Legionella oakridgensis]HBD7396989.1 hypothetical protein [Legionella pneumophila]ARB93029.1 hypothetical protein A6J40_12955 [Legionella longbeachae]EEZ96890.1 hypothetical protein LLB_2090 [Legionella longbeachae D-4968]QEY52961.1 hypothetical protein FQU71_17980 [Legionella longbeachae]